MGQIKEISIPKKDNKLAEFIGIMLGDGNIYVSVKDGIYQIKVTTNSVTDREYLLNFVKPLFEGLFKVKGNITFEKKRKGINLRVASMKIVLFLNSLGLPSGDKIYNQVTIPKWIKINRGLLIACLRGLFDTDGTVFHPNKNSENWVIGFKNYNLGLLKEVRESLILFGFHPTNITGKAIFITRKEEARLFTQKIGFNNPKHYSKVYSNRG